MIEKQPRMVFVNLAVRDLPRSVAFFTALGFDFDPRFTDDSAACLILNEQAFAMLIVEPRFRDFTPKPLVDARTHTEVLVAISASSREQVDAIVRAALEHCGAPHLPPQDLGFMYSWSFQDPDGHVWEPVWMDPGAAPPQP